MAARGLETRLLPLLRRAPRVALARGRSHEQPALQARGPGVRFPRKRILGGVSRGVSGDFHFTSPPPYEPTEPVEKKLMVRVPAVPLKIQQKATWADGGQWGPILGQRSFEQREQDLAEAVRLGLVTAAAPALHVERRHPFYRTGPCDGCALFVFGSFGCILCFGFSLSFSLGPSSLSRKERLCFKVLGETIFGMTMLQISRRNHFLDDYAPNV